MMHYFYKNVMNHNKRLISDYTTKLPLKLRKSQTTGTINLTLSGSTAAVNHAVHPLFDPPETPHLVNDLLYWSFTNSVVISIARKDALTIGNQINISGFSGFKMNCRQV